MPMSAKEWNDLLYGGRPSWRLIRAPLERLGLVDGARMALDVALSMRNRLGLAETLPVTGHDYLTRDLRDLVQASGGVIAELDRLPSKGVVWFPHFRGSWYLELFEIFLAWRLRFDGYRPLFIQCGGLPICNNYQLGEDRDRDPVICRTCRRKQGQLLEASGHKFIRLETSGREMDHHQARVSALGPAECRALVYRDVPVGDIVVPSVARHLRRTATFASSPDEIKAWRDYVAAACILVDRISELLDRHGELPVRAIIPGGWFLWFAVADHLLRARGVQRSFYETALHDAPKGDRWVFSRDVALTDPEWITPLWNEWRDQPLTPEENTHLDAQLSARRRGSIYHPAPVEEVAAIRRELALPDDGTPTVVLFTGLTWDYAVYGKGRPAAYNDLTEWVADTIRLLSDKPVRVVVRIHPAEAILHEGVFGREHLAGRLGEIFGTLPPNVTIVPPESKVSSYVLMEIAAAAIVYASTIGLETAISGRRPLVMAAYSILSGRGFGLQPKSRDAYAALLADVGGLQPPAADEIEAARRFTYLYFFRTSWPIRFFASGANGIYSIDGLLVRSLEELRPGAKPHLDHVARAVMGGDTLAVPRALYPPPV